MTTTVPVQQPEYYFGRFDSPFRGEIDREDNVYFESSDFIALVRNGMADGTITETKWAKLARGELNIIGIFFTIKGIACAALYVGEPEQQCAWVWTLEEWKSVMTRMGENKPSWLVSSN